MDLISVVIPIYNSEKHLEKCIYSVINQSYKNLEIILVDDGSTDSSLKIMEELKKNDDRIKIIKNSCNLGVCESRNKALSASKGEWIAFIDSDDIWDAQKLEIQLKKASDSEGDFIFSNIYMKKEGFSSVKYCEKLPKAVSYDYLKKKNIIALSTVIIKKSLIQDLRFEKEDLHEDYILWLKILGRDNLAYGVDRPLTTLGIRKDSRSSEKVKSLIKSYNVYRFVGINRFESIQNMITNGIRGIKKYYYLEVNSKKM